MNPSRLKEHDELLKQAIMRNISEAPEPDIDKAWKRFEENNRSLQRRGLQKRLVFVSATFSLLLLLSIVIYPTHTTFAFKNAFFSFQKWGEKAVQFIVRSNKDDENAKTSPPPDVTTDNSSISEGSFREKILYFPEALKMIDFVGRIPTFVPSGYKLNKVSVLFNSREQKGNELRLVYENMEYELLSIFQKHLDSSTSTSNEGSRKNGDQVEVITIHGIEGKLSISGNGRMKYRMDYRRYFIQTLLPWAIKRHLSSNCGISKLNKERAMVNCHGLLLLTHQL